MYGNLQTGDILFIRGHSPISSLIKYFDGEYSHCAIVVSDCGTRILESQRFVKSRICSLKYTDLDFVSMNLNSQQKEKLREVAIRFCDFGYDYKKFIGYAIEKIFKFKKSHYLDSNYHFLCSELIELVIGLIGAIPIDKNFGDKTPNELFEFLINNGNTVRVLNNT
jgi:hypothetical protein